MASITGGTAQAPGAPRSSDAVASPTGVRVAEALLECTARWGWAKTTVEDVARTAGVSRATVYRLFPGGKTAILHAAIQAEVLGLAELIGGEVGQVDDLEECLVRSLNCAAEFLESHDALTFLRQHEWVALKQVLAFDRLDAVFAVASAVLAPQYERFLDPDAASATGVWLARLLVSHLFTPSPDLDLRRRADVEQLVRTFVLPGLRDSAAHPSITIP